MKTLTKLKQLPHCKIVINPNQKLIPVTLLEMNDENMDLFNEIYFWIKKYDSIAKISRTYSHGISIRHIQLPAFDVRKNNNCVEMTILIYEGMWRIQFRNQDKKLENQKIGGRQAFNKFIHLCKEKGIELNKYGIKNGKEVKEQIESPFICLERMSYRDIIYTKMNHIDFHSSYPAGLVNTHPEFKELIEELFEKRKTRPMNKAILNFTIGWMQSIGGCNARYSHLAKDAIHDNNKRIMALRDKLIEAKRMPILYNTDGIWYLGDVFHGDGEGKSLGEWTNDFVDCKFRAKSAGCYEFEEANGTYHAVVRGRTLLDDVKPREMWKWGDIYDQNCVVKKYNFSEERGIFKYESEDSKSMEEII